MEFNKIGLFGIILEQWALLSEKKCNILRYLDSGGKKLEIFKGQKKNVDKLHSPRWPVRPDLKTQCKYSENKCKLMPQCFQIWQVSAKYCCFLDFSAHFCAIYPLCIEIL